MDRWTNFWKKIKIIRSLRIRIFVIIMLVGIIPSIIMRHGILDNYETRAVSVRMSDVQNQMRILANHLITYSYMQGSSSEVINSELELLSNLYDGRVLIIDRSFKVIRDTYGISEGKTIISEEVIQCFQGKSTSKHDGVNGFIELTTPIVMTGTLTSQNQSQTPEENTVYGVMLTSVSTESITLSLEIFNRKALILEFIMIIIILGIAIAFANMLARPFARVTQAIHDVKEGFSDEEIKVSDYLETEHILDAFNQLLGRMKMLDESRQEFVANVSHELKTPLTSVKVLADSLLQQPDAPVELYREFMVDITNEIDRENKIINDLLSLVKMDKKAAEMNISSVSINDLLEMILKRLRPIARKQDVEVVFESIRPVTAEIDEVKFTLAISNLVENAIKYNKPHGWVKVVLDADHQFFTIDISDSGIGIPSESLEYIFERFYRVDKSHSREIGGTGLGLAITRSAILMHRGSVKAESIEGLGTTFSVKMPISFIV